MNSGKVHPAYAMVADYVPRRCGIATFTADLTEAIAKQLGETADVFAMAVNDVSEGYDYPGRVRFEIRQNIQADYRLAAEFLNVNQVSTVCVQHEYGIYGGTCGTHVLAMMRHIRRPLVTTLHTVLKTPDEPQRLVLQQIGQLSDRMVVMSEIAREFLREIYQIPPEKLAVIPHGIPDVPFLDPNYFKDQFGCEGRRVLLTFGLLSPGKGIETVIEALPQIVRRHGDVLYIVLGAVRFHHRRLSRRARSRHRQRKPGRRKHARLADEPAADARSPDGVGARSGRHRTPRRPPRDQTVRPGAGTEMKRRGDAETAASNVQARATVKSEIRNSKYETNSKSRKFQNPTGDAVRFGAKRCVIRLREDRAGLHGFTDCRSEPFSLFLCRSAQQSCNP